MRIDLDPETKLKIKAVLNRGYSMGNPVYHDTDSIHIVSRDLRPSMYEFAKEILEVIDNEYGAFT